MVETRSRKRGTGESDGVTRITRSSRNVTIASEPSALVPKAKRQRTTASSTTTSSKTNTRATRSTRALKPVATNVVAENPSRGVKSTAKKQSVDYKVVAKKPRGRQRKEPLTDVQLLQQQQKETVRRLEQQQKEQSQSQSKSIEENEAHKKPRGRQRKQPLTDVQLLQQQQKETVRRLEQLRKEQSQSQSKCIEENEAQQQPLQPQEKLSSTGATRAGVDDANNKSSISATNGIEAKPNSTDSQTAIYQHGRTYQDGEPYNIDERDKHDPLAVTDYVEDMYKHFMWKEEGSSVNRMYMGRAEDNKQPNITESMRCILVDWLIEVHYKFKLFPETLYLTINILDRFLSDTTEIITKRDLQLVGVTSLLVAAKYEEMYVPELRDLTYICDGAYTEAKILRMEEKILKTLRYNVTVPTPHTFLVRYLKAAKADKLMAQLASFLLDGTLLSLEKFTCRWRPSQMAAAAILLARRQVGRHNWSPTLVAYSSYREEMVLPVAKSLLEQKHRLDQNVELMALAKKYSKTKYGKVSHISFLPLDDSEYEASGDDSLHDTKLQW